MRIREKLAIHILLFCIFAAALLNLELALGGTLQRWNLPAIYALYVAAAVGLRALRHRKITRMQIGLIIILPLACLLLTKGLSYVYDTSWDGQDYQQSAVIELANGWNPWRSDNLPLHIPVSQEYVVGYPKTTWLLQASVYKLTGKIQSAPITNAVVAVVASVLVFELLVRLRLRKNWALIITILAVAEIHFLQQLPTFMADGYSYQLGLIAIAALGIMMIEWQKAWAVAAFLSAWLLLAGSKFSNLFVCALLGLVFLVYAYHAKLYHSTILQKIVAGFAIVGLLILWAPYGTNALRYHSPVYPQNQPSESGKLRFDNVPNNLKKANRAELLFYGVFSSTEPSTAGNPTSPQNVARLKWPFTFHTYEIHEVNNYQGRVGSGGFLFSGIVVLALVTAAVLLLKRPTFAVPGIGRGVIIASALIVIAALVIPVSNKLRYSPLITALPLLVVVLLASVKNSKLRWPRIAAMVIVVFVCANTVVSVGSMLTARISDARTINAQLSGLRQTHATYYVEADNFYANYIRLQEHGVPIVMTHKLLCAQPEALQFSYGTTLLCRR